MGISIVALVRGFILIVIAVLLTKQGSASQYLYVAGGHKIAAFRVGEHGQLIGVPGSPFRLGSARVERGGDGLIPSPDGRWLYVSARRGKDDIESDYRFRVGARGVLSRRRSVAYTSLPCPTEPLSPAVDTNCVRDPLSHWSVVWSPWQSEIDLCRNGRRGRPRIVSRVFVPEYFRIFNIVFGPSGRTVYLSELHGAIYSLRIGADGRLHSLRPKFLLHGVDFHSHITITKHAHRAYVTTPWWDVQQTGKQYTMYETGQNGALIDAKAPTLGRTTAFPWFFTDREDYCFGVDRLGRGLEVMKVEAGGQLRHVRFVKPDRKNYPLWLTTLTRIGP